MRYLLLALSCLALAVQSFGQATAGTKKIKIGKTDTYLNFPIDPAAPAAKVLITLGGKPLDQFTINLAQGNPKFWVYFDVAAYQGKTLAVNIEDTKSVEAAGKIFSGTTYPGQDSVYKEKGRPQVHFTAQRGWINDPNGLLYENGEYHLYFQHNPYGWPWGNMHWGHAVSADLIHWKQLPEAIFPVIKEGVVNDAAFSGSAVIDPNNTGGFRKNGIDPVIAVYTSTGRGECLKLSYDKGRTFEEYAGNPILKHEGEGRDPKVFWYEPGNHWVMVVWDAGMRKTLSLDQQAMVREHSIYTSPDLKHWTYQSGVAGFFECPELFELPLEGAPHVKKWVMYDANGRYIVGDFNGKQFTIEQHFTKYEHGGGYFYASQIYNNTPDGKRIQVGWGRDITHPGMPFNQPMLFPTELKLKKSIQGEYRLCPTPISAINSLHQKSQVLENRLVTTGKGAIVTANPEAPLHIVAEFERGDAPFALNILGYELKFDNEWMFSVVPPKGSKTGRIEPPVIYVPGSATFKIEAIVDKNLLEFFINDGERYYVTAFDGKKTGSIEATVATGDANRKFIVKKLEVHELASIWSNK